MERMTDHQAEHLGEDGGESVTATDSSPNCFFKPLGEGRFLATEHTGGAWDVATQHVASSFGLLTHCIEVDRDTRRGNDLMLTRLSYDILGTMPLTELEVEVEVLRPGRSIELVEAVLSVDGRPAVRLRAWLQAGQDTSAVAGHEFDQIPAPGRVPVFPMSEVWLGGTIEAVEVHRDERGPGRAVAWIRTAIPLVGETPVSDLARLTGLVDIANGIAARVDPAELQFPNLDLTAHLLRQPHGDWLGLDTRVAFGPDGVGLTSSVLHDEAGPFGTSEQILTLRTVGAGA